MIKINSPILENKDGKTYLKAYIENEKEGVSDCNPPLERKAMLR